MLNIAHMRCGLAPVVVAATGVLAAQSAGQPAFQTLGPSLIRGVSADGTTLVGAQGTVEPGSTRAMRWRAETGFEILGGVPQPFIGQSIAFAVNADGEFVVGRSYYSPTETSEAFLWSQQTGMIGLGSLPGGGSPVGSTAFGVSDDGAVVVGFAVGPPGGEAFRWTATTGMVGLGGLPGNPFPASSASAVSADGTVVVGRAGRPDARTEAFRWTAQTGMVGLGLGPAGSGYSQADAVSADGSTIVGLSTRLDGGDVVWEAFRWTESTGMMMLGHLPEVPNNSYAVAVSGDGAIVVGNGGAPWIWDEQHGMRWLHRVLIDDFGVDLSGFALERVHGISADGRTIVGSGLRFATGHNEGWIATIPSPATASLVFTAAGLASGRRWYGLESSPGRLGSILRPMPSKPPAFARQVVALDGRDRPGVGGNDPAQNAHAMPQAHTSQDDPFDLAGLMAPVPTIDAAMERYIGELGLPSNLAEAIRYSLLGPGKRMRPLLVWHSCAAVGGDPRAALPAAAGIEMIHAFSLVHDDLPGLDNDDLRRGRPTLHKHTSEAMAILAGDAMLTLAFKVVADRCKDAALAAWVMAELAESTTAMIAGQVYDTLGGFPKQDQGVPLDDAAKLELIHHNKTGALIRASCRMGARCGGASDAGLDALTTYGESIGLMFQIVDDLLDVTQTTEHLGKKAGKDQEAGKLTYPGVFGVERSQAEVRRLHDQAMGVLSPLGPAADPLRRLCAYMAVRSR